jgi:hypothetical protein
MFGKYFEIGTMVFCVFVMGLMLGYAWAFVVLT